MPQRHLGGPLAFHQQAADEVGGNLLGGAAEEGVGEGLGGLGRAIWLWEWLDGGVLRVADGTTAAGL